MFELIGVTVKIKWAKKERRWNLEDLTDSDYGEVDPNGIYDVDDFAYIDFIDMGRYSTNRLA